MQFKEISTSRGVAAKWPNFKLVFKGTLCILRSRCETVISGKCPSPLYRHTAPTQTYTRQLDWQGGLEACYFLLPLSSPRTSWSSPSLTHGRVLVNRNGCLLLYFLVQISALIQEQDPRSKRDMAVKVFQRSICMTSFQLEKEGNQHMRRVCVECDHVTDDITDISSIAEKGTADLSR